MNSYFATVGLKLSNTLPPPIATSCRYGKTCADKGETDSPRLTDAYVSKSLVADKIKALKTRKSTGPDNISPKLLKLAGDAIVPSLRSSAYFDSPLTPVGCSLAGKLQGLLQYIKRTMKPIAAIIVGFHMTSLKFKLKNYLSYRDFTFTMH